MFLGLERCDRSVGSRFSISYDFAKLHLRLQTGVIDLNLRLTAKPLEEWISGVCSDPADSLEILDVFSARPFALTSVGLVRLASARRCAFTLAHILSIGFRSGTILSNGKESLTL